MGELKRFRFSKELFTRRDLGAQANGVKFECEDCGVFRQTVISDDFVAALYAGICPQSPCVVRNL